MIDGERKIKELYNCEYITSDKELYPLQKWYNKLIDKMGGRCQKGNMIKKIV